MKFLKDCMIYYQFKQMRVRVKGKRTLMHLEFNWVRCGAHNGPLVTDAKSNELVEGWLMVD